MTAKTTFINPFAAGNFAQNRVLKLFVAKERKLTTKPFAGRCRAFRGFLINMQHTADVLWFNFVLGLNFIFCVLGYGNM